MFYSSCASPQPQQPIGDCNFPDTETPRACGHCTKQECGSFEGFLEIHKAIIDPLSIGFTVPNKGSKGHYMIQSHDSHLSLPIHSIMTLQPSNFQS